MTVEGMGINTAQSVFYRFYKAGRDGKNFKQLNVGGSFRHLIYDLFEFDLNAYTPLQMSGGLDVSNALFDAQRLRFQMVWSEDI
jgi:hypothetical protein